MAKQVWLNLVYWISDWRYRIRAERGRRLLVRAQAHLLFSSWGVRVYGKAGITVADCEAVDVMWAKYKELGGRG